jgi:hypothetical protein
MLLAGIGLAFIAAGVALCAWQGRLTYDFQWRLAHDPVHATARVVDLRTNEQHVNSGHSSSTIESTELQYEFAIPGRDHTYRSDGWIAVPEHTWKHSRDSGEIAIEYLKGDPAINQPREARHGIGSAILFVLLGLVFLGLGGLLLVGGLRRVPVTTD